MSDNQLIPQHSKKSNASLVYSTGLISNGEGATAQDLEFNVRALSSDVIASK